MSDFKDALRRTMSHENRAFEQADADLRAETDTASVELESLTDNRGSLTLGPAAEEEAGVRYQLRLLFRPASPVPDAPRQGADRTKQYGLGTFLVPWKGYPIQTGHGVQLPDRPSIAAYFLEMASNPASPGQLPHLQPAPAGAIGGRLSFGGNGNAGQPGHAEERLFKMWYHAGWFDGVAYATSEDGSSWQRPKLDVQPGIDRSR
jgi:hypothetical protein